MGSHNFFFLNGNSMKITTSNSNKNSGVIINTSKTTTTTTTETSKKKDEERRITRLISVKIYEWKFPCDVYILSIRFALNWPVFLVSFTSIWMHTQEIATTVQFLFVCMFTAAQSIDWLYRNPASDLITLWDGCNSVILWERFDLICWFDLNTASFGCFKGNAWWRQQLVLRENQNAISFFLILSQTVNKTICVSSFYRFLWNSDESSVRIGISLFFSIKNMLFLHFYDPGRHVGMVGIEKEVGLVVLCVIFYEHDANDWPDPNEIPYKYGRFTIFI